jgi:hypothetical protein
MPNIKLGKKPISNACYETKSFWSDMLLRNHFFLTTTDAYTGRHLVVIHRRKEAKSRTLQARREYNRTARERGSGL